MMKKEVKKIVDKGFLLSVGLASIGMEKADKIVRELIRKGKLNEKEGRKLVRDLIKKSKAERKKIRSRIVSVRKRATKKKRRR